MPEDDPSTPDLSDVTTEWLLEELIKRHDALLIAREIRMTDDRRKTLFQSSGGLNAALGLARRLQAWLDEDLKAEDLEEE